MEDLAGEEGETNEESVSGYIYVCIHIIVRVNNESFLSNLNYIVMSTKKSWKLNK